MVEEHKALQFLPDENPSIKALIENHVLLPDITRLAFKDKLDGVLMWLNLVENNPSAYSHYTNVVAKAMEDVICSTTHKKGLRAAMNTCLILRKILPTSPY